MIFDSMKKTLVMTTAVAFVLAIVLSILTKYVIYIEPFSQFSFLMSFLNMFGAFMVPGIIVTYLTGRTTEDDEQREYTFYENYVQGRCRVIRFSQTGNARIIKGMNFLDEEGNLILKEWVTQATPFLEEGVSIVQKMDGRYNIIDKSGTEFSREGWAALALEASDGKIKAVNDDGYVNFISIKDKTELWKEWKEEL